MSAILNMTMGGVIGYVLVTNLPQKQYDIFDKHLFTPFGQKFKSDRVYKTFLELGKITYNGIYFSIKELRNPES